MSPRPPLPLPALLGGKRLVFLCGIVLFCVAAWILGPQVVNLPVGASPFSALIEFFSAAISPAMSDQNPRLPAGADSFLVRLWESLLVTFRYALIAMNLSIVVGLVLGVLASRAWWPSSSHWTVRFLSPVNWFVRVLIALMRSIHELIWVMFFLSAIGDQPIAACVAIAIPFAGTLAKVFSELIDEQAVAARDQLRSTGGRSFPVFLASTLPQTLPDLFTYTLYRFECALRAAAVLGFIGVETIGFTLRRSFENLYWNEVWTSLYTLILVVVCVEAAGAALRRRLNSAPPQRTLAGTGSRQSYWKIRSRWLFPKVLAGAAVVGSVAAWTLGRPLLGEAIGLSRSERIERFLVKLTPEPVVKSGDWSDAVPWAVKLWERPGQEALVNTLAIASAAIVLAAFAAMVLVPWASRVISTARPFGLDAGNVRRFHSAAMAGLGRATRWLFVLARAVPEYVIAFLLIGLIGPGAWPLVIALALHNFGIFGRLWAEVIENQPTGVSRQLMQTGASRGSAHIASVLPRALNHFLLYFFYRWETCVREATILGMLGISSLGLHITLARSYLRYDRMLFYVLLGAAAVLVLDMLSNLARRKLRT